MENFKKMRFPWLFRFPARRQRYCWYLIQSYHFGQNGSIGGMYIRKLGARLNTDIRIYNSFDDFK